MVWLVLSVLREPVVRRRADHSKHYKR
jgi:hypothetical protein